MTRWRRRKPPWLWQEREGPCYIRFGREAVPVITDEDSPFEIGKANVLRDGKDAVLFANGAMVYEGLEAASSWQGRGST